MKNNNQKEGKDKEFILPYQSPQIQKQVEILKAYCILSEERKRPVQYKEVAELVGISDVTISGNHKFFVYCGFLESSNGDYLPSEQLMKLTNRIEWKKLEEARQILRIMFEKKWFSDYLSNLLQSKGEMTKDKIINELGVLIGAKRSQNILRRLNILFEWIKYAGIIHESTDNTYKLNESMAAETNKKPLDESLEKPKTIFVAKTKIPKEIKCSLILAINITPETTREELKNMIELAIECTAGNS
jgi:hypothetical protein